MTRAWHRYAAAPMIILRALRWLTLVLLALLLATRVHAADDEITEYRTIPAGSYIVNMGIVPQTTANGLRPYGMVYDLVKNHRVPVLWSINPAKVKDGVDFGNYRGGPFIIEAPWVTVPVLAAINSWRSRGVVVDGPIPAAIPNVPIYDEINGLSNVVLDFANGKIAAAFFTAAGVPTTAYTYKFPNALTSCDDFYAMPHADPTWNTHRGLVNFVRSRGYVWAGCHAVSVLENVDDPSTPTVKPDMNFLTVSGMVPYGSHSDGSPPYTTVSPGDPVMQFMGVTDAAHQNGSEQIFMPAQGGGWRPGTKVLVYDPTQADVPARSPGAAAALVYGRAYDFASNGRVMYEGGHNIGGTAPANIAAQRSFLNFWLLSMIERSPDVRMTLSGASVAEGSIITLSSNVTHTAGVSYQWVSSAGGTFGSPNSPTTTFSPPEVSADTTIQLRLIVTDACGRNSVDVSTVQVLNNPRADLSITKRDSSDPVAVGQNFSYVLSVANLGPDSASGVQVVDTLPAGTGFVSATGSGWTCTHVNGVVTCNRGTLDATGSTPSTITINVTAPPGGGTIVNTAAVSATTPDPVGANNSATEPTTILQGIDVAISKTVPQGASFYVGQPFNYTLQVQNVGAVAATSLTVKDVLPETLTFVSASGIGWNCVYSASDRTATCFLASLAAMASSTITLRVAPSSTGSIPNTATVSSPDFADPSPENNSSTVTIGVLQNADLAITKSGSTTGGGGSQVDTFVVTLTNNGPGVATGVSVRDVFSGRHVTRYANGCSVTQSPAGVGTLSPASPWSLATIQAGGTWNIASMASGASATLTFVCAGDNNDGVLNRATVSSASHDPNTENNTATAFVVDGTTKNGDLQLTKTASPSEVLTGGAVTYRITANNLGNQDANGTITVVDTLPAGMTYQSFSNVTGGGTWSCSHNAGTVTCTTTTDLKKVGGSPNTLFFDLVATAPAIAGSYLNTATVSYPWGNDTYDPPANNTATASTSVIYASTDIGVTKTVDNATPSVGSTVVFTVRATNNGPNAASNLRLTDVLPAGLSVASTAVSQGSYDRNTGLWYVGALASGANATLTVTARVGIGAASNTACLYAMDQTDTNALNNCATASVVPQYADLALTKTAASATVNMNANAVFTVRLVNNGPSAASNVTVQDILPSGLVFVSASATSGTFVPTTGAWTIADPISSGAAVTLTLTARVAAAGVPLVNTAQILSAGVYDPDTSNNAASATVTGASADIQIDKAVNNATPTALNTDLTFTVTVRNYGPSPATGVVVKDLLPAGLAYVSHTASSGSYAAGSGLWSVGSLASYDGGTGAPVATLTMVARNTSIGTFTNTASKEALDQFDPDTTNDSSSVDILSGGSSDLEVTKIVDAPDIPQGGQATFTVRVRNLGPDAATGVVISDPLPAGLGFTAATASQGTYDSGSGQWTLGNLAVGQVSTLSLTTTAATAGVFTNTASVAALNQADPDASNNTASAALNAQPAADLAVTQAGPASALLGASVTYTIVVRNNGPSPVTGAVVSETIASLISGVSWTCVASGTSDCSTTLAGTGATGTGNAITLSNVKLDVGAGNILTITVTGTASAVGTAVNTVIVSPPSANNTFDTNTANNSATVSTAIGQQLLSGRVFADTGTGGGLANDGVLNGGEAGIAKVTVRLTDCASTTYSSTTTGGDGTYGLALPSNLAAGATLCVVQTNLAGYLSTGAQVGTTGGAYDRTADRVQFTLATNPTYVNVNFADVPENRFLTDGTRTAAPGTTVTHQHVFVAGTGGEVSFTTAAASSPSVRGWAEVLYLDGNCDGVLNAPIDTAISGPVTVTEGQRVCLLMQEFVPAGAPIGATNLVSVTASFVYTRAAPALLTTYTRQDLTTVSNVTLVLTKEVRNVTQNGPWLMTNQARTGDELEYRIQFANNGTAPIDNLVVRDMTPAYTSFVSAQCVSPLPANLTTCVVTAPSFASTNSGVVWQFTGSLAPNVSGNVLYRVKVQ